ncbi:MAG: TIGR03663 family protein [Deltaproteobacteria bacterium]|nr:TIGR03663 family protein [Deltaproteobacteria bacterium]
MIEFLSHLGLRNFLVFITALFLGIFFRFYKIDERPLHHDESIHAQLAYNFYKEPSQNFYKYDPVYHGPTFYLILRYFYHFVDFNSDISPRLPIIFFSIVTIFALFCLTGFFSVLELVVVTSLLLLSPVLIYYSRFAREDYIVILGLTVFFIGCYRRIYWLIFVGLALQFATKANFFINIVLLSAYLLYVWLRNSNFPVNCNFSKSDLRNFLLGLGVGLLLFVYLITTEFRNWNGVLDVTYKSLKHWYEMHKVERISGPFSFHLSIFAFHEQVFFVFLVGTISHFVMTVPCRVYERFIFVVFFLLFPVVMTSVPFGTPVYDLIKDMPVVSGIIKFFKLKGAVDLISCMYILIFGFWITDYYLKNDPKLSFLCYLFFSNLFVYSYVGEKVPWLAVYPLFFGYIFFGIYWAKNGVNELIKSLSAAGGLIVLFYVISRLLNFVSQNVQVEEGNQLARLGILFYYYGLGTLFVSVFTWLILKVWNCIELKVSWSTGLFIFFLIYTLLNLRVNFSLKAREFSLLSQVQTNIEFRDFIYRLIKTSGVNPLGRSLKIGYTGEATWPLAWYVKDDPKFIYFVEEGSIKDLNLDCIFIDEGKDIKPYGFNNAMKIPIRSWIYQNLNEMSYLEFLRFFLFKDDQPGLGSTYTKFACKEGVVF